MPSDKAIKLRDDLNKLVDELLLDKDDRESNVLACCVALAVEEVEKWMYQGNFTPSVAPYREGKEFHMPGIQDNPMGAMTVPEIQRNFNDPPLELAAFKRIKEKADVTPIVLPTPSALDRYDPGDWDDDTMRAFRDGNKPVFLVSVRNLPGFPVPMSDVVNYFNKMVKAYPYIWKADKKTHQPVPSVKPHMQMRPQWTT